MKDVQNEIATRQDINDLKKEIKQEAEKTKGEMKKLELRITIKLSAIMFSLLLAFKMFDKFL